MSKAPVKDDTNGASIADVLSGKTFWGLTGVGWGLKTGTYTCPATVTGDATAGDVLATKTFSNSLSNGITGTMANNGGTSFTPTTAAQTIAAGYYDGSGSVSGDTDLVTGNIKSGVNIFGVSGKTEVVDTTEATSPAAAADILSGKKAYVNGAAVTGTVTAGSNVTGTAGSLSMTIPDGLYSGAKTATANDTNLLAANIVSGKTIFGVPGSASAATSPAPVLKTGQTICSDATSFALCPSAGFPGQDGDYQKGVVSPNPRFNNNGGDNTITDKLTGLMWLRNANLAKTVGYDPDATGDGSMRWDKAYFAINDLNNDMGLFTGGVNCGYTDWRMPNINELNSLIHLSYVNPALTDTPGTAQWVSNSPFINVKSSAVSYPYMSGTRFKGAPTTHAFYLHLNQGFSAVQPQSSFGYLWPVRLGQP